MKNNNKMLNIRCVCQ